MIITKSKLKQIIYQNPYKEQHMGGVAGHLAHLYDNRDLTYNKMAEILEFDVSRTLDTSPQSVGLYY